MQVEYTYSPVSRYDERDGQDEPEQIESYIRSVPTQILEALNISRVRIHTLVKRIDIRNVSVRMLLNNSSFDTIAKLYDSILNLTTSSGYVPSCIRRLLRLHWHFLRFC